LLRYKNQRKAYVKAGYKANPKTVDQAASNLFRKVKVARYLAIRESELNEGTRQKTGIDRDWVIERYKDIHDRCAAKGKKLNAHAAISALDGISRVMGFNAPQKFEGTLRHVQVKEIAGLPKDELLELAQMQTVDERQN
jgi:hypothetical protein